MKKNFLFLILGITMVVFSSANARDDEHVRPPLVRRNACAHILPTPQPVEINRNGLARYKKLPGIPAEKILFENSHNEFAHKKQIKEWRQNFIGEVYKGLVGGNFTYCFNIFSRAGEIKDPDLDLYLGIPLREMVRNQKNEKQAYPLLPKGWM